MNKSCNAWQKCPILIHHIFIIGIYFTLGVFSVAGASNDYDNYESRCIKIIDKDERGIGLNYPTTLFFDKEMSEVYAVCSGERQLVIYADDFFPIVSIGKGRGVTGIRSCCTDRDSIIICTTQGESASQENGWLQVMDRALLPAGRIVLKGFAGEQKFRPTQAQIIDDYIYVVGTGQKGILVVDRQGNFQRNIIPSHKVLGIKETAPIKSFTHDSYGRLFLLSETMGIVFVFSQRGEFIYKFGKKGGSSGKLSRPRGIAIDNRLNLVYVVDYMRHAINVYNKKGEYLFEIGGQGVGRGWFSFPSDVCVDARGRLWVADTFNQRLQVFKVRKKSLPTKRSSTAGQETANPKDEKGLKKIPKIEESDL